MLQANEILQAGLALAKAAALRSHEAFVLFSDRLEATGVARYQWPVGILKRYETLRRIQIRDEREYLAALNAVQPKPAPKSPAKESESAPQPDPDEEPTVAGAIALQTIRVKTVDGQIVEHDVDLDAAFWVNANAWHKVAFFRRQFSFVDEIVPAPYAYVLKAGHLTFEPTRYFSIAYETNEFKRLCELELETNSPVLLDGQRLYQTVGTDIKRYVFDEGGRLLPD